MSTRKVAMGAMHVLERVLKIPLTVRNGTSVKMSCADFEGIREITWPPEGPLNRQNALISGISKHALKGLYCCFDIDEALCPSRQVIEALFVAADLAAVVIFQGDTDACHPETSWVSACLTREKSTLACFVQSSHRKMYRKKKCNGPVKALIMSYKSEP